MSAPSSRTSRLAAVAALVAAALLPAPPPAPAADAPEQRGDEAVTDTLRASDRQVVAGETLVLTGRASPHRPGIPVTLDYRPAGGAYQELDLARTDRRGRFSLEVAPEQTGSFRAAAKGAEAGDPVRVAVESRLTAEGRKHQLRSRGLRVRGDLEPPRADRRVTLQRLTGKGWMTVAADRTDGAGRYRLRWESPELGGHTLRAVFRGEGGLSGDKGRVDHPVYVYRSDLASYYGPGFYGNRTACGQILRRDTVGVAHKTLPCGTHARFHYRGRTRRLEVIDRGPFIGDRRWDLTNAARRKLGFPKGVDEIWATK